MCEYKYESGEMTVQDMQTSYKNDQIDVRPWSLIAKRSHAEKEKETKPILTFLYHSPGNCTFVVPSSGLG